MVARQACTLIGHFPLTRLCITYFDSLGLRAPDLVGKLRSATVNKVKDGLNRSNFSVSNDIWYIPIASKLKAVQHAAGNVNKSLCQNQTIPNNQWHSCIELIFPYLMVYHMSL